MTPTCPTCQGVQLVGHPAGVLEFDHRPDCALREREDATRWSDFETANSQWPVYDFAPNSRTAGAYSLQRPATDTERILLAALGFSVPEMLTTDIDFISHTTRRRTWPALIGAQQ